MNSARYIIIRRIIFSLISSEAPKTTAIESIYVKTSKTLFDTE